MSVDATIELDTFDLARLVLNKGVKVTIELHVGNMSDELIKKVLDDPEPFLTAIKGLEDV